MFASVGELSMDFKRLGTSRYLGGIPTPFGSGGSWRHSFYWNIYPQTTSNSSQETIHVDYPDGRENDFTQGSSSANRYYASSPAIQERIIRSTSNANQYSLYFPDGHYLSFHKTVSGSNTLFTADGVYDRFGQLDAFLTDAKNRVVRVTEPGGRYIQMTYGPVGNFAVANVTFSFTNRAVSSASVAGSFNGWSTTANPMTHNSATNTWSTTVPVPLALGYYEYKFFVNGSTWISDPAHDPSTNNPPGAGNNSVLNVIQDDPSSSYNTAQLSPVAFSYTNVNATSVCLAGEFNGWSTTANPLTNQNGVWTTTINLANRSYDYKFVVNGNQWVMDPNNSFTDPDGNGGYNSRITVGVLDEAITQVATSDGRWAQYVYSPMNTAGAIYSTLTQVNYSDGTSARYTYVQPNYVGRPLLKTADDPRYAGAIKRIQYTYQVSSVEGFVASEASLDTGTVIASANKPSDEISRTVSMGNGATESFTFNSGAQIANRTDSLGNVTQYTYFADGAGMLQSSTDPNGNTTTFERTYEFGCVTKKINADNSYKTVAYTDSTLPFYVSSENDELGHTTSYTRDFNGRVTQITYSDGGYETFTYNSFGQVTTHRLRNGGTETDSYDNSGLKVTHTDALNNSTSFAYDGYGRLNGIKDPLGHRMLSMYDEVGNLLSVKYADNTSITCIYDKYGNRLSRTNELGKMWSYAYDEYSRLVSITDPLNRTTQYDYGVGVGGCSSCAIGNYMTRITTAGGEVFTFGYDSEWHRISKTVGWGTADAATTQYNFDGAGNITSIINPDGKIWKQTYDNRNRRISLVDPLGNTKSWAYDVCNDILKEQRADNTAISYMYDAMNRRNQTTDALNQTTQSIYDVSGNLVKLIDPLNHVYTFAYDLLDRKSRTTYPDNSYESWSYDGAGNVYSYTTRSAQIRTSTYDARNREIDAIWSNGSAPELSTSYDSASRVLNVNNVNSALSYVYDDAGQLTSETQNLGGSTGSKTVAYIYNADGYRSQLINPDGTKVSYSYTGRNQVSGVNFNAPSPLVTYTYDPAGNRIGKILENGTSSVYTYDDANRMASLSNKSGNTVLDSFAYTYNSVNNRTSVTYATGLGDLYDYDPTNAITSVQYGVTDPNGTASNPQSTQGYAYDAVGNRVNTTQNGLTTSYTTNTLNEYTQIGSQIEANDSNGNVSTTINGFQCQYDSLNRLVSMTKTGSGNGQNTAYIFAYDGRNRCVQRTISLSGTVNQVTTTNYVYDGWNLVAEYDSNSGNQIASYVQGAVIDEMLICTIGAETCYYHYDALGSVTALSSANAHLMEQYTYDVFGQPTFRNASGTVINGSQFGNRFLFTGREWLSNAGVYDYRNRIYSAVSGRFMQTDSVGFTITELSNLYRYVSNNPTDKIDPKGLYEQTWPQDEFNNFFCTPAEAVVIAAKHAIAQCKTKCCCAAVQTTATVAFTAIVAINPLCVITASQDLSEAIKNCPP